MPEKYIAVHFVSLLGADGVPSGCCEPGEDIPEGALKSDAAARLLEQGSIRYADPQDGPLPYDAADLPLFEQLKKTRAELAGAHSVIKDQTIKITELAAANEMMAKQLELSAAPVESK